MNIISCQTVHLSQIQHFMSIKFHMVTLLSQWLLFTIKWAFTQLYDGDTTLHFHSYMMVTLRYMFTAIWWWHYVACSQLYDGDTTLYFHIYMMVTLRCIFTAIWWWHYVAFSQLYDGDTTLHFHSYMMVTLRYIFTTIWWWHYVTFSQLYNGDTTLHFHSYMMVTLRCISMRRRWWCPLSTWPTRLNIYSASSLKQQSEGGLIDPPGNIILIRANHSLFVFLNTVC
jgi:hypothetical protein